MGHPHKRSKKPFSSSWQQLHCILPVELAKSCKQWATYIQLKSYVKPATSLKLQAMSLELWAPSYKLRAVRYEIQATKYCTRYCTRDKIDYALADDITIQHRYCCMIVRWRTGSYNDRIQLISRHLHWLMTVRSSCHSVLSSACAGAIS
jgi:hypothetical protein